jgi:hypothetical protein
MGKRIISPPLIATEDTGLRKGRNRSVPTINKINQLKEMLKKLIAIPMALALVLALGGFTAAHAQIANPTVRIQMATNGLTSPLVASSTGATVARLMLDTTGSGEPISVSSLPFILSTGNGALPSSLNMCQVYNESNPTVALNSYASGTVAASTGLVSGMNRISLSAPIVLQPNTSTVLDLRCNVDPGLVSGGTYTFSMNTGDVIATGTVTGRQAVVTVNGPVVVPPVVVVPGLPTTGAGSNAATNIAVLMGTVMLAGLGLVMRNKKTA